MEMKIKHKISKLGNKVDIGESIESGGDILSL